MNTPTNDYPILAPYLVVLDAAKAIEFYKAAFGAKERYRLNDTASGRIGHAELLIYGGLIMLSDEAPAWNNKSPSTLGGTPVKLCLMVDDVDGTVEKAKNAGATVTMPPMDAFYGFRSGSITDPYGHEWMIQREIEKVAPEEMQRRWDAMIKECPQNNA